ncbi:hypothetical protein APICC_10098 [Apis cerana cerana]|uniref:Uncharacterized protein n=1 Tax=Apis cerana cerana TaxID=94128 RepID=A0A2A3E7V9_APICC|nr:hypothetical protein APICC_10098 [Apis cerana cerana]
MRDTSDMMSEDSLSEDTMMDCEGDAGGLDELVDLATDVADSSPTIRDAAERLLTLLGVDEEESEESPVSSSSSSEDEGVELDGEAPATAARRPLEARPGRGSRSDGAGTRVVLERRLGCMRHGGPQISGRGRGIAASSSHGAGHEGPSGDDTGFGKRLSNIRGCGQEHGRRVSQD